MSRKERLRVSSLCVIPARGGSKRIPHKNIREFCGRPIIAYSIEAALTSGLFDEVMVSTDDEKIAAVAKACGASVPFMRSAKASDDFATTADVLLEVLAEYGVQGRSFDTLCCLYPTAPFVTAKKLRVAAGMLGEADCVLSTVRFSFPPQRGMVADGDNLAWWQPENELSRSQDLEPVYHDAGQFYFRDVAGLLDTGRLVIGKVRGLEVPELEAQDIDNEADWQIAQLKYERMTTHL